jgi:hypothetical protein
VPTLSPPTITTPRECYDGTHEQCVKALVASIIAPVLCDAYKSTGPDCDPDADGIANHRDACPNEPGPATTQGCPDQDRDGIADRDDACPTAAGPPRTTGCPDRDGDGVRDSSDACPDEHGQGSANGCPPPPTPPPPPPDGGDEPGSGSPDTAGEAPTYADEPPGDDGFGDSTDYSVSRLSCPVNDPYKFVVRDDYQFEGALDGYPTPEAAVVAFLAVGKMLPPIPLTAFQPGARSTTRAEFVSMENGQRRAIIATEQGPAGGWTVAVFAACGAFLDAHLPAGERGQL